MRGKDAPEHRRGFAEIHRYFCGREAGLHALDGREGRILGPLQRAPERLGLEAEIVAAGPHAVLVQPLHRGIVGGQLRRRQRGVMGDQVGEGLGKGGTIQRPRRPIG